MELNQKQTARLLWDYARTERRCIACQVEWFGIFAYGRQLLYDFEVEQRRKFREGCWKYSRN